MSKFAYEYGRRWAVRLPRNDLRTFVSRIHCGETEEYVAEMVRQLLARQECMRGKNARLIPQCLRFALCVFRENRDLYRRVLRGNI